MSCWSTCNAIIGLYTYKQLSNFENLVKIALENAPQITGSEGNCQYHIIDLQQGASSSYPCTNCPFYSASATTQTDQSCPGYYFHDATIDMLQNCPLHKLPFEVQTNISRYYDRCKIIISDMHGLRDKQKTDTLIEFQNFIKYLKSVYNGIFEVEIICKNIK